MKEITESGFPLEHRFDRLAEVDIFVAEVATALSDQLAEVEDDDERVLLGSIKGPRLVSEAIKAQANKHGFHGQLRDIVVFPTEPDKTLLPKGMREMDERIQSLDLRAQMHSSGRGIIGQERAIVTLFVPPEKFFRERYSNGSTILHSYLEQGEPLVLFAARTENAKGSLRAMDQVRFSAQRIDGWAQRLALGHNALLVLSPDGDRTQFTYRRSRRRLNMFKR
ncbi:hypothetical protein E6Q11_01960 [Candidatus Dojkabacteria bacterium]|uniref:Uncharacterized protein n=1 Tax=Candidatus Dojkabacteria bacterium TaxID=2099670 RepID=A0A5C7J8P7_9BACT|nr:MAG: hypothetical protein E6Q11_01960 [Candidatus Dojkabacteria bacterium]